MRKKQQQQFKERRTHYHFKQTWVELAKKKEVPG